MDVKWRLLGTLRSLDNNWDQSPDTPGIYIIRRKKPIPRIGGIDTGGIIYVGQSKILRNRLWDFWHSSHNASGFLWINKVVAMKILETEYQDEDELTALLGELTAKLATPIEEQYIGIAEKAVLYAYARKFGELPPLNSSLPDRWGDSVGKEWIDWANEGLKL